MPYQTIRFSSPVFADDRTGSVDDHAIAAFRNSAPARSYRAQSRTLRSQVIEAFRQQASLKPASHAAVSAGLPGSAPNFFGGSRLTPGISPATSQWQDWLYCCRGTFCILRTPSIASDRSDNFTTVSPLTALVFHAHGGFVYQ